MIFMVMSRSGAERETGMLQEAGGLFVSLRVMLGYIQSSHSADY